MDTNTQSQWSGAALEGIILSLFTLVPSFITVLIPNGVVSAICWVLKTGGSLTLLFFFMKRWARESGAHNAFGYGFKICLCSSLICAAWSFILYKFIAPEKISEVFDTLYSNLGTQTLPYETEDMLNMLEDNFAQFSCGTTLLVCILCGLIFSAIFGNSAAASNVFSQEGTNNQQEDEEL